MSFYQRAIYVMKYFNRYSNETMDNLIFNIQLRKNEYDRLNNVIGHKNYLFIAGYTLVNFLILAKTNCFFIYRNLSKV